MEKNNSLCNVCVTGGSGYIGSWLVKKLLEKGHTVHATLRNLGDTTKVGLLKSLPNADSRLVLFQADLYKSDEFEKAIKGCQFVFHVATPMPQPVDIQSSQDKDSVEATVSGMKSIADCCMKSQTVKRLIYTASVTASSPLKEDGSGYESSMNESCWTSLNLSYIQGEHLLSAYSKSKTLAEKGVLRYNEIENGRLEVVTLVCGLVAGDTLLSYVPFSIDLTISQLTGNLSYYNGLRFLQELLGSVPLLHIDDVCEAHLFCMERPSLRGRFICAATDPTMQDMLNYYQENYPQFKISEEFMGGPQRERGSKCDSTKLVKEGFQYKYDMKKILDDSVDCGRRLGVLEPSVST